MAEIFDLRAERVKRKVPLDSYFVRIDLYEDGIGGEVQIEDIGPDELRFVSENLFALARHIRDHVWVSSQDEDDRQVSVTRIYKSGRVSCWTSDDIATEEQSNWLAERFEDAAEASRA